MTLPMFDKKRGDGSATLQKLGKGDLHMNSEMNAPSSGVDPGLQSAAEDILMAIESKSPIDLAHALQAAYDICESQEPEEAQEGAM